MNAETSVTGTDLVAAVDADTSIVLTGRDAFEAWLLALRDKVVGLDPDVSVRKNREAIREAAADIGRKSASVERDRLRLTKEWRDMTAKVNEAGKDINEKLKALQAEVRKPLTDWEDAEKARVAGCEATIARIKAAATVTLDDTAASVKQRGFEIYELKAGISAERYQDFYETAMQALSDTVGALQVAMERLTREEADKAELERLREAARLREEEEARVAAAQEAARKEAEDLRLYNERREAAERAEQERIERAKQEAAEAERQRIQREHEEALVAERRRAEEAEATAQAERDRIAKEEADRKAEADRIAAEQRQREADQAHRTAVKSAAKTAIMSCGADEETARKIVVAILANEIPNVTLRF